MTTGALGLEHVLERGDHALGRARANSGPRWSIDRQSRSRAGCGRARWSGPGICRKCRPAFRRGALARPVSGIFWVAIAPSSLRRANSRVDGTPLPVRRYSYKPSPPASGGLETPFRMSKHHPHGEEAPARSGGAVSNHAEPHVHGRTMPPLMVRDASIRFTNERSSP